MDKKAPEGYAARTRLTDKEINKRVDKLDPTQKTYLLRSLAELLYGTEADENWGADTLDALAQLMYGHGLTP